jgi:hypothetical protein
MRNRPSPHHLQQLAHHVRQAAFQAALRSVAAADEGSPMTVARAAEPRGPARLAQMHAAGAARVEAEALYQGCLRHYRDAVQAQDLPCDSDDAGAAVAHFVAACVHALDGTRATPEMLTTLQRQLLPLARSGANWATASVAERQMFFEQVALLAVLIDGLAQHAGAKGAAAMAQVRGAARVYLRQFLGLDPDTLALDANGLTLRPEAPARKVA